MAFKDDNVLILKVNFQSYMKKLLVCGSVGQKGSEKEELVLKAFASSDLRSF